MAIRTKAQLNTDSIVVRDETVDDANTAARVGNLFEDFSDSIVTAISTEILTNKTFDANATGNSLSNVDIADLANGTDGELITWDSAGAPTTVTVGTTGQILTSNGAGAAPTFQSSINVSGDIKSSGTGLKKITVESTSAANNASYSILNDEGITKNVTMINYGSTAAGTFLGVSLNDLGVLFKAGGSDLAIGTLAGTGNLVLGANDTEVLRLDDSADITIADASDIILNTSTGTKIGTATSQKLGLWNATPIIQPTTGVAEATFVENAGGAVINVDSTAGGYTFQQIVQALQNIGGLA